MTVHETEFGSNKTTALLTFKTEVVCPPRARNFTLSSPRSLFATFISENIYNKLRAFIIG